MARLKMKKNPAKYDVQSCTNFKSGAVVAAANFVAVVAVAADVVVVGLLLLN